MEGQSSREPAACPLTEENSLRPQSPRVVRRAVPALAAAVALGATVGVAPALAQGTVSLVPSGTTDTATYSQSMGTDEANRLEVTVDPGTSAASSDDTVTFVDSSGATILAGPGCSSVPAGLAPTSTVTCAEATPARAIFGIAVDAGSMDDVVRVSYVAGVDRNLGSTLTGGAGNDTLTSPTGSFGVQTLLGGEGNDLLTGGGTKTTMQGGPGADELRGGAGQDVADYSDKTAATALTIGTGTPADGTGCSTTGPAAAGCEGDSLDSLVDDVIGGSAADVVVGSVRSNTINGGGGDDVLQGLGGFDSLFGEAGNDALDGGDDRDILTGGAGDDLVAGGPGDDQLDASSTDAAGNDVLSGGPGEDDLTGGAGNDSLRGGPDADTIAGGAGTDTLTYDERTAGEGVVVDLGAMQRVAGGALDGAGDTVDATLENVTGGSGDDTLRGDAKANALSGGPGVDVLDGGAGVVADALDGGTNPAGSGDTVSYANRMDALTIALATPAGNGASGEGDTLAGFENAVGGAGADKMSDTPGVNRLEGRAGNDELSTRDAVADVADCGAGTDVGTVDALDTATDCETVTVAPGSTGTTGSTGEHGQHGRRLGRGLGRRRGHRLRPHGRWRERRRNGWRRQRRLERRRHERRGQRRLERRRDERRRQHERRRQRRLGRRRHGRRRHGRRRTLGRRDPRNGIARGSRGPGSADAGGEGPAAAPAHGGPEARPQGPVPLPDERPPPAALGHGGLGLQGRSGDDPPLPRRQDDRAQDGRALEHLPLRDDVHLLLDAQDARARGAAGELPLRRDGAPGPGDADERRAGRLGAGEGGGPCRRPPLGYDVVLESLGAAGLSALGAAAGLLSVLLELEEAPSEDEAEAAFSRFSCCLSEWSFAPLSADFSSSRLRVRVP